MTLLKELFALNELKNHMGETEYSSYKSWKAAVKKAVGDSPATFIGDSSMDEAQVKDDNGKMRGVGEWDGSVGVVYKKPAGLKMNEGRAMDDIAIGGTVIYKSIHDKCYKMSKARQKNDSNLTVGLQNGDTVQTMAIVSTDSSDWSQYKDKMIREGFGIKKPAGMKTEGTEKLTSADAEKHGSVWVVSFTHCPGATDKRDFTIRAVKAITSSQAVATAKAKLPKDIQDCAEVASVKMTDEKVAEGSGDFGKSSFKRKEMEFELGHDTRDSGNRSFSYSKPKAELGSFGIEIDGRPFKREGEPVKFSSKATAEKVAGTIASKDFNKGKTVKVVPLKEDSNLQALGKGLRGRNAVDDIADDSTTLRTGALKPTKTTSTDAEVDTDVNTPPADKAAMDAVDDEASPSEFKVGDKVKPSVGPHKDVVHSVIHVFPDGRVNLKPDGLQTDQIKYRLGAVTAQPSQVVLAETRKFTGSLLAQFSLMEAGAGKDGFMPLGYGPKKGHTIEAYGRKGMKNTMWRKMFKSEKELEKWVDDNDATVEGQRELDDNEKR